VGWILLRKALPLRSALALRVRFAQNTVTNTVQYLTLYLYRGLELLATSTSNPRERYYHRQMAIHASKYKHFI
jgi:hypothetical protein